MFKARCVANVSNGLVSGVPVPASFVGYNTDVAATVLKVRDGGAGPFLITNSQVTNPTLMWPVYCANGIHVNVSGGNATIFYV